MKKALSIYDTLYHCVMAWHVALRNPWNRFFESSSLVQMDMNNSHKWFDGLAIMSSFMCLLHCLALPLLIAILPPLATLAGMTETVHIWILLVAIPTSLFALVPIAWRTKDKRNLIIGCAGLGLLCAGLVFEEGSAATGAAFTVCGSLFLGFAHVLNWRLRYRLGLQH